MITQGKTNGNGVWKWFEQSTQELQGKGKETPGTIHSYFFGMPSRDDVVAALEASADPETDKQRIRNFCQAAGHRNAVHYLEEIVGVQQTTCG
jgi:hypothetical protein